MAFINCSIDLVKQDVVTTRNPDCQSAYLVIYCILSHTDSDPIIIIASPCLPLKRTCRSVKLSCTSHNQYWSVCVSLQVCLCTGYSRAEHIEGCVCVNIFKDVVKAFCSTSLILSRLETFFHDFAAVCDVHTCSNNSKTLPG